MSVYWSILSSASGSGQLRTGWSIGFLWMLDLSVVNSGWTVRCFFQWCGGQTCQNVGTELFEDFRENARGCYCHPALPECEGKLFGTPMVSRKFSNQPTEAERLLVHLEHAMWFSIHWHRLSVKQLETQGFDHFRHMSHMSMDNENARGCFRTFVVKLLVLAR